MHDVTCLKQMGQPSLIYKFLDLASRHSIWNSKMGAAFSLGSIIHATQHLTHKVDAIVPKLYRYQFDPDPKVLFMFTPLE